MELDALASSRTGVFTRPPCRSLRDVGQGAIQFQARRVVNEGIEEVGLKAGYALSWEVYKQHNVGTRSARSAIVKLTFNVSNVAHWLCFPSH